VRVSNPDIAIFIVVHKRRDDIKQAHERMSFSITDPIKKLVHEIDHAPVVPLVFDRAQLDWSPSLKLVPSRR
jgi:hypothetical protein